MRNNKTVSIEIMNDPNATAEERRDAATILINNDGWSLQEYIDWLNRPEEGVIKGGLMAAPEWARYDITKASQLGDYLDACFERERQKNG